MADVSWRDLSRVDWGETLKLALARGFCSALVLMVLGLVVGAFRSFGSVLGFFIVWPFAATIGATFYFYMLRLVHAVLAPIAGCVVTLVTAIGTFLTVALVACGDPLVFALSRAAPGLLRVSDLRPFNFHVLILVFKDR